MQFGTKKVKLVEISYAKGTMTKDKKTGFICVCVHFHYRIFYLNYKISVNYIYIPNCYSSKISPINCSVLCVQAIIDCSHTVYMHLSPISYVCYLITVM